MREGTAAHFLLSHCLGNFGTPSVTASKYIGWIIDATKGDGEFAPLTVVADPDEGLFEVDQEMATAVQVAVDEVAKLFKPGCELYIEEPVDLTIVHPGAYGRLDIGVWVPSEQLLVTIDFKYGSGRAVEVSDNKQVSYYALGLVLNRKLPARKVRLGIVQPRCYHDDGPVRYCDLDLLDLLDFRTRLIDYARATEDPNAPLVPGEHCKVCDGAWDCEALKEQWLAIGEVSFNAIMPYDPEALAKALEMVPGIEARVNALREFAYQEAISGRVPPRHKLGAKHSRRRWNSDAEIVEALSDFGATDDQLYKKKLRSPAQMEETFNAKVLAPFIIKESSGMVLVAETDRRKALDPPRVAIPFQPVTKEPK